MRMTVDAQLVCVIRCSNVRLTFSKAKICRKAPFHENDKTVAYFNRMVSKFSSG
jgi:hypothetical protein